MLRSYLRMALRVFRRNKGFSFLNIAGLSVGLACAFLILIWIRDELAYDRFHERGDRLYQVMRHAYYGDGQTFTFLAIPKPLEQEMRTAYPEVDKLTLMTWQVNFVFNRGELSSRESGYYAGPEFFEMMSFPLLEGNPTTVLDEPTSVVISESLARKYFGDTWKETAVGDVLRIDGSQDFTVTGIFADIPRRSSLRFEFILPAEDFIRKNAWVEDWGSNGLRIIALMKEGLNLDAFNAKFKDVVDAHDEGGSDADMFLKPFPEQHLYSRYENAKLVGGRIEYVRAFGVVALFIILIACINFTNLTTARSMRRAREIGVRKAIGAGRKALAAQFLGESALFVIASIFIALALVAACLGQFNNLTEKDVSLLHLDGETWLLLGGIGLVTALLAGLYPAIYLSSFNAIKILRGTLRLGRGGAALRKGLVVFQFTMSILLIVGTVTVYRQIEYIQTKNLGLDRMNLVSIALEGGVREQFDAVREELLKSPGIVSVGRSSGNPLDVGQSTTGVTWEGKDPESNILFHILNVDHDLVETMRMQVVSGRDFDRAFASDTAGYVVNRRAAEIMGMEDPVGQGVTLWSVPGTIIGMVDDFHMTSLHDVIEPTILRMNTDNTWRFLVRLEPERIEEGLASFRRVFEEFNPGYPFDFQFVDEEFNRTYRSETVVGKLANYFAVLAVFIACLGLFGLAAFTSEQRRKEIGIRKTLGATLTNLILLLSTDLVKLVLIAVAIAVPLAYVLMQKWLENFAYHVSVGAAVMIMAGAISVLIAALTVSYQSIRTALADPIKALRIE